jgi:hypothetical protein
MGILYHRGVEATREGSAFIMIRNRIAFAVIGVVLLGSVSGILAGMAVMPRHVNPTLAQTATDYFRNMVFRVMQRFTAKECFTDAPGVVRRFLLLLDKNG